MEKYIAERFIDGKTVEVHKRVTEGEYMDIAACGARILFEYDEYRFLDTICPDDKDHYVIIKFDGNEPEAYYEMNLKAFYDLVALYNNENFEVLEDELNAILQ